MALKDEQAYLLIFFGVFVLTAALFVVTAKAFDRTPDVTLNNASGLPPFPASHPNLPVPTTIASPQCVSFCIDPVSGAQAPCGSTKLTQCATDGDCLNCAAKQQALNIKCLPAKSWPTVERDQAALNNSSEKYCLPEKEQCLNKEELTKCATDTDCVRCTDELPNGESMTCQTVASGTSITTQTKDGKTHLYEGVRGGQYCLPKFKGCDPQFGIAQWTSNEGWKCTCKYPGVYSGEACNEPVACRSQEVTSWSKDKQRLLLNMPGTDGSAVGEPWTMESGVDPNKCIDPNTQQQVECKAGLQPTVACQCDGIQTSTGATFTYDPARPLTCVVDNCYANPSGGRTVVDADNKTRGSRPNQLFPIPNQPVTGCACSGYESRLWTRVVDPSSPTEGYTYMGYCAPFRIPGTNIFLPAGDVDANPTCKLQANTAANVSGLVPGQKMVQGAPVDTCAYDPCAGNYADPLYRTTQSRGYFDAMTGFCACYCDSDSTSGGGSCSQSISTHAMDLEGGKCDRTVNPVCSYCAAACEGEITSLCPVAPGSNCSPKCVTDGQGRKTCLCGDDCFWYNGACRSKKLRGDECEGFHNVPGTCALPDDDCRPVFRFHFPNNCEVGKARATYMECFNHNTCGSGMCEAGISPCP